MKNEGLKLSWELIENLMNEIEEYQKNNLIHIGRKIIPELTTDDLLQPNDFPDLENNPHFRYEEGVYAGILTVQTAIRHLKQELD